MNDIDTAKEIMIKENCSCVLCRGDSVFKSYETGIKPLIKFCAEKGKFEGFSAADRIVGKAAAYLYAYMNIKCVYGSVMSTEGERVLKKYGIEYSYGELCEKIINRAGTGICPMELAVDKIENKDDAYTVLCEKLKKLFKKIL